MSWIIPWNGKEYDVDPTEFSGIELSLIKQRTGLGFKGLVAEIGELDGDAIRALFWTVDRRDNQELKFSDYEGPAMRFIIPHIDAFEASLSELMEGKARTAMTSGTDGSPSSLTALDGPEPSTSS